MQRIVIIGNSGAGKSYLASQLGAHFSIPVTHLDTLFWKPGGYTHKRPDGVVLRDIRTIRKNEQWIVEGVFGELVAHFLDHADGLIWLNMDWETCRKNLLDRGSESEQQRDPEAAKKSFAKLLTWASQYWDRDDARSFHGHQTLFDVFEGHKWVFQSRLEVDRVVHDPSTLR